jgi:putative flippase GtrA
MDKGESIVRTWEPQMNIARQGLRFLMVGCGLILVDWLVFVALTGLGVDPTIANIGGRIGGACLGFWANGAITFGKPGSSRLGSRRFLRFLTVWIILTVTSTILVSTIAEHLGLQMAWLAKPVVEGVLAIVSFIVSRHWVYR